MTRYWWPTGTAGCVPKAFSCGGRYTRCTHQFEALLWSVSAFWIPLYSPVAQFDTKPDIKDAYCYYIDIIRRDFYFLPWFSFFFLFFFCIFLSAGRHQCISHKLNFTNDELLKSTGLKERIITSRKCSIFVRLEGVFAKYIIALYSREPPVDCIREQWPVPTIVSETDLYSHAHIMIYIYGGVRVWI